MILRNSFRVSNLSFTITESILLLVGFTITIEPHLYKYFLFTGIKKCFGTEPWEYNLTPVAKLRSTKNY